MLGNAVAGIRPHQYGLPQAWTSDALSKSRRTHWFPARRFATLTGLGLLVGKIGALFAQVPLRLLVESFGWRPVSLASAVFMLATGVLAMLAVRNDPSELGFATYAPVATVVNLREVLKGLRKIFGYRNTWLIFCAQGGFVGAVLSFTGLWGPPFLKVRYGISSATAAGICSVMIVCWASASPVCGYLSDRFGQQRCCPPEDVGGVPGYEEFLEVIFQPDHEEFGHYRQWAGDGFWPERFELQKVNETLTRMRWPKRHRLSS